MSSHFLSPHLPFSSCDSCLTSCPLMKSFLSLKAQLTCHLLSGVESSTTQLSRFSVLCLLGSCHSFAYTIHSYPVAWFCLSLLLACECMWAEPLLFIILSTKQGTRYMSVDYKGPFSSSSPSLPFFFFFFGFQLVTLVNWFRSLYLHVLQTN